MAYNRTINEKIMSERTMKGVLAYVLRKDKVKEGYVEVTGPYQADKISVKEIYREWSFIKQVFNKEDGRLLFHHVISFHKDDWLTLEEMFEIAIKFVKRFLKKYQCLIAAHFDKVHWHIHILANTVSFINGEKLHHSKYDLEEFKFYTNKLCFEQGGIAAIKGAHFRGEPIEPGTVITHNSSKYCQLTKKRENSYLAACVDAIESVLPDCTSWSDFLLGMDKRGWNVIQKKAGLVFEDEKKRKVSDRNLSKTFNMEISQESLSQEFIKHLQQRNTENDKREQEKRAEMEELKNYYRELEELEEELEEEPEEELELF